MTQVGQVLEKSMLTRSMSQRIQICWECSADTVYALIYFPIVHAADTCNGILPYLSEEACLTLALVQLVGSGSCPTMFYSDCGSYCMQSTRSIEMPKTRRSSSIQARSTELARLFQSSQSPAQFAIINFWQLLDELLMSMQATSILVSNARRLSAHVEGAIVLPKLTTPHRHTKNCSHGLKTC